MEEDRHIVMFVPKFYCELNTVRLSKFGDKRKCTATSTLISPLLVRQIVDPALDSVSTDLILKYFRKVQDYETTYLERKKDGKELEKVIKF